MFKCYSKIGQSVRENESFTLKLESIQSYKNRKRQIIYLCLFLQKKNVFMSIVVGIDYKSISYQF